MISLGGNPSSLMFPLADRCAEFLSRQHPVKSGEYLFPFLSVRIGCCPPGGPTLPRTTFQLSERKDRRGKNRRVATALDDAGLCDVPGLDDLAADPEDFLFFVPALIHVEIDAEGRCEHGGGEILRIVPCLTPRLAEGVMLADIAVSPLVCRYGAPDGCGQEPTRFIAATTAHDAKGDSAGTNLLDYPVPSQ